MTDSDFQEVAVGSPQAIYFETFKKLIAAQVDHMTPTEVIALSAVALGEMMALCAAGDDEIIEEYLGICQRNLHHGLGTGAEILKDPMMQTGGNA